MTPVGVPDPAEVEAQPSEPSAAEVEAFADLVAGVTGHETFAFGQGSYDGDACRACSWQGPPRSGNGHRAETRKAALVTLVADRDRTRDLELGERIAAALTPAEEHDLRAAFERDKWAGEWNSLPTAIDRLLATRAESERARQHTGTGGDRLHRPIGEQS